MFQLSKIFVLFVVIKSALCLRSEEYFEELDISPLPNGFLSATFKFLTRRRGPLGNHYDLFPKAIGEIAQRYGVEEFHLSMSQNQWRSYQWGYQPQPATPTGAQLWAWFNERNGSEGVDIQWRDTVHALSGLFCASFAQIDTRSLTVQPEREYRPRGILSVKSSTKADDNRFLRYAILPSDNVCTENLTPWKKLLPCKSLGGIGSLLVGTKLFTGHFFALSADLRQICGDESKTIAECMGEENVIWEWTQTLTVVFDMAAGDDKYGDWSLMSLFGTTISSTCPVAKSSLVFVDMHRKILRPVPGSFATATTNGNRRRYAVYDVAKFAAEGKRLNNGGSSARDPSLVNIPPPPVYVHSFVAGSGVHSGRLISRLFNYLDITVPVLYSHSIPWYLRTYYHTLKITCDGKEVEKKSVVYKPARDRKRPHYFEIAFDLPPSQSSHCDISINFDRALLRYVEYPPDANHGFPIAAPMISFYAPIVKNHTLLFRPEEPILTLASDSDAKKEIAKNVLTVVFGKTLLVNLPTPDFSMPYNVICLVCTVVALAFGPIHSLTTKTLTIVDPEKSPKSRGVEFIKSIFHGIQEFLVDGVIGGIKSLFFWIIGRRVETVD